MPQADGSTGGTRGTALALALLLASCAAPAPEPAAQPVAAVAPVCRIGPNGGPVVADRGIGGSSATPADLRAGQLAAIEAGGGAQSLQAQSIQVHHEVSGPVEAMAPGGVLIVAGQRVALSEQTWRTSPAGVGDWVQVSGLRRTDGVIAATRIDPFKPSRATLHGMLLFEANHLRIGTLEIRPLTGLRLVPGESVVISGRYGDGVLYADNAAPDRLAIDPAGYFGPRVGVLVLEGYVLAGDGTLRLGGLSTPLRPGFGPVTPGRAVVEFARQPDGSLEARSLRAPASLAPTPQHRLEPAPIPNHAISGPGRGESPTGPRGTPAAGSRTRPDRGNSGFLRPRQ